MQLPDHLPSNILSDEGLQLLGQAAAGTKSEFKAFLDALTARLEEQESHPGVFEGVILHRPSLFKDHLNSQDIGALGAVLKHGEVIDRVVACLRILRIPASLWPADAPVGLKAATQRLLSRLLVEHPVLMHNRIFVKELHFAAGGEHGPIATVIGRTPGAEFSRLSHDIDPVKLRAFSRHHCVRAGLTEEAPSPRGKDDKNSLQGKTMLGSITVNLHQPRPGLLTSILELDAMRASGSAASARPASFLRASGKTQSQLCNCFAATLLCAFGISGLKTDTRYDPSEFLSALVASGIPKEDWFLGMVEANLYRWVDVPEAQVRATFDGLARALVKLEPRGLEQPADESPERRAVRWLVAAVLDSSSERAASVGLSFKNFPHLTPAQAVAFIEAVEQLSPESAGYDGLAQPVMEAVLEDRLGDSVEVWRAALRVHVMQAAIRDSGHRVANDEVINSPAARRRSRLV